MQTHSRGTIAELLCGLVQVFPDLRAKTLSRNIEKKKRSQIDQSVWIPPVSGQELLVCLPLSCMFFCMTSVMFTVLP